MINLQLIRQSLDAVGSILAGLKYRVLDLGFERSIGTYTNKCSRADLKVIAGMVGARASWRDAAFEPAKAAVRARYDLGSRDFCDRRARHALHLGR